MEFEQLGDPDMTPPEEASPIETFTALAAKHGLTPEGQAIDPKLVAAMTELVGLCADAADAYGGQDASGGEGAGSQVRASYSPK